MNDIYLYKVVSKSNYVTIMIDSNRPEKRVSLNHIKRLSCSIICQIVNDKASSPDISESRSRQSDTINKAWVLINLTNSNLERLGLQVKDLESLFLRVVYDYVLLLNDSKLDLSHGR